MSRLISFLKGAFSIRHEVPVPDPNPLSLTTERNINPSSDDILSAAVNDHRVPEVRSCLFTAEDQNSIFFSGSGQRTMKE